MINGYVDESEDGHVFAMGGFVAPADEWAKFSDAWKAALDAPPKVRVLKTKDAMQSPPQGAFWGLTDEQRDEKLRTLYSVIDAHAGYSVYTVIHLEPLKRLAAQFGFAKQAANPYYHAISQIIIGVAQVQKQQGITDERVDWIFDKRVMEEGKFLSVWEALVHDAPDDLKPLIADTPAFRSDDDVRPLQAADLEAWWMRRREIEKIRLLPRLEYPWNPTDMPICGSTLDEVELRKRFENMDKMREHLAILDPNGDYF